MKKIIAITTFSLTLILACLNVTAQTQSREDVLKEIEAKRAELALLEKNVLAVADADREAHANFLAQSDTGIVRLMPREIYDSYAAIDNKRGLAVRGGGSYFSFTSKTHDYSSTTDIGLEQGYLKAGFAGANYGMIASLGDVSLDRISFDTSAVRTMANHQPPTRLPQARVEQRRFGAGEKVEDTMLKDRVKLNENTTYVLRTVNYSASDVLVAFRVVRLDSDNSAIVIWKLLKQYPIPELARN